MSTIKAMGISAFQYKSIILTLSIMFISWAIVLVIRCHSESNHALVVVDGTDYNHMWWNASHQREDPTKIPLILMRRSIQYSTRIDEPQYLPSSLDETLADMIEPYNHFHDVPFFWQIPKAGTTFALAYLSRCLNLTLATRKGQYSTDSVRLLLCDSYPMW